MALRLAQVFLPEKNHELLDEIESQFSIIDSYYSCGDDRGGIATATAGVSGSLIGVMVAVALLPPLMVFGLLLGGGHINESINAFLIFATNIVCLNISGVVMFLFQGIRPNSWWEKKRAKKQTRIAIAVWMSLLAILVLLIKLKAG